jgi:hypothetical protein
MSWHELPEPPILGALNEHIFVTNDNKNRVLMRSPIKNLDLMRSIGYEYSYMGFFEKGGKFRQRSAEEQFLFNKKAAEIGLSVIPPIEQNGDLIYYPFISEAKTLDVFINDEREKAVPVAYKLVDDLYQAHKRGFIYGDRWSHNILIHPKFGLIHIDFDLEIKGPCAREFEIAQIAYYTLSAGKSEVIVPLAHFLGSHIGWFDIENVDLFMRRHATYFNNTSYGGIQSETENFLDILHSIVKD